MLVLLLFVLLQDSQTDITVLTPYTGHVRSTVVCLITGQPDRHCSHYLLYWTCQVYCCLSYYRIARQTLQSLPPILDMLGLLLFVLLQDSQTDIAVITSYTGHVRSTVVCLITGQPDRHYSHYPLYWTCQVSAICLITGQPDRHYSHYPLYWTCQVYCCLSYYRIARQTLQSLPHILDILGLLLFVLLQDSQTDITVITPYTGHVMSTAICLITGQPDRHYSHYPLYWTCYVYCCLSYYRIARQTLQSLPPILDMLGLLLFVLLQDSQTDITALPPILDMLGLLLFVLLQDSQTDITVITPILDMLGLLLFVLLQDSQADITVITLYIGPVKSTAVCLITGQPDRHYSHYPLYRTCYVYCCLSYYRIARQTLQSLPPILDMLGLLLFVLLQDNQTDITVLPPILDMLGLLLFVLLQDSQTDITVITPYIGHVRSTAVCHIT